MLNADLSPGCMVPQKLGRSFNDGNHVKKGENAHLITLQDLFICTKKACSRGTLNDIRDTHDT